MSLEKSILGMGNPLLDISAEVDDAFLAKYEVRERIVFFDWTIENRFFFSRLRKRRLERPLRSALWSYFHFLFDTEQSAALQLDSLHAKKG